MKNIASYFGAILSLICLNGFAQDGSRDLSFGNNGVVITDLFEQDESDDNVYVAVQDPNERIIVAGKSESILGDQLFVIAYLEDGTIDSSFGDNGIVLADFEFTYINRMLIQSDGKIILGKGSGDNLWLKRILPNGDNDLTFGDNGNLILFPNEGYSVGFVLTSDDKILISAVNNDDDFVLKQFLKDGEIDLSFGQNGTIDYEFGNSANQPKGQIQLMDDGGFMVGLKIIDNGETSNIMVKFNENGDIDMSYGIDGIITNPLPIPNTCAPLVFANGDVLSRCQYWNSSTES